MPYKKPGVMRRAMYKMIKSVALKNTETKVTFTSVENQNLFHNGGNTNNFAQRVNLLATTQGTADTNRIGDEVFASYLRIKLWLSNKLDRPNVMYRILVYTAPVNKSATADFVDLFKGGNANRMLGIVNSGIYKLRYHKMIQPKAGDYSLESGSANKERSTYHAINIPLNNRRIKYQATASQIPRDQQDHLVLAIIAYDAFGTLTTDNIASYACQTAFYYKDP